jgi:hypothetical protein
MVDTHKRLVTEACLAAEASSKGRNGNLARLDIEELEAHALWAGGELARAAMAAIRAAEHAPQYGARRAARAALANLKAIGA